MMKIMLVCAGGMSTGILMKKMEKWGEDKQRSLDVLAFGLQAYEQSYQEYDCILVGPQIAYKLDEIKSKVNIPVTQIESFDYAIGNVDNIMKQVDALFSD